MEFIANGSLAQIIQTVKPLPLNFIKFITAEIVLALERIHSFKVAHRDLKPENIMLTLDYHVKLCDFGEAKVIENIDENGIS